MVQAQQWLDKEYPNKLTRQRVERLAANFYAVESENAFKLELEGFLNIIDFVILKKLYLNGNELASLVIINCPKIELINCTSNLLTDLGFLVALDPKKLTNLYLENNNISEQDLSCFGGFINLTTLLIGNSDHGKIRQDIYNRFTGSLEFLQNLTSLKILRIENTDIDSGLEYLPRSVKEFHCSADPRTESKVKKIEEELEPFLISKFRGTYDFNGWKRSLSESEQTYNVYSYKPSQKKGKRKIFQKEIEYQESNLEANKLAKKTIEIEKEQQQLQQMETNFYKK